MSMIGKSLIHYEITAEIGKGGMGEVYQAKDTKLGRDVAIKVLPEEFALDKDRVARFQREAKLLASLNHPNIAAIHGLEESEGTHFLVMELIEGDTLRDRIKTGPIPVEEALKLALQMAEALEAAHENGVIHRDLKPANIKVTPDGKVKILDFGLAKAYEGDQGNISLADSPTISAAATQQGVILGTAAYMSPEQARGKPVDKRADIWAFGVVLYEMLTGKSAFSGTDVTDTLAAVIRSEPEWKSLPANLHWRLREVLERSLEKEAKDRYGSISDARVDIQKALADPSGIFAQQASTLESKGKWEQILLWASIPVILLIILGVVVWNLKTPESRQVVRLDHYLTEDQQVITSLILPVLDVSSDGTLLVFSTPKGIYLRSIDQLEARFIAGTDEDPITPFFSPDGQWIGYFAMGNQRKLKKISVNGGVPTTLCSVGTPLGASWGTDDTIVYGEVDSGIMRISANGGTPEVLTGQSALSGSPQILPNGKSLLFTTPVVGVSKVAVQSLDSKEYKELFDGSSARYLPTGHLLYTVGNSLYAVSFDPDKLEVTGGAVSMIETVFKSPSTNLSHYAISNSGTLIYLPGQSSGSNNERTFMWVDRDGKEELLNTPPNTYRVPKVSPDGREVATAALINDNTDIYIWNIVDETLRRLTFDEADDSAPIWTPDGERIIFWSGRDEPGIYWKNADGTGEVNLLFALPDLTLFPWSWSGDGNTLAILEYGGGLRYDISTISMEDDPERIPLFHEEYAEAHPRISPDGRYIAYMSLESGEMKIYVRPFPDVESGGQWLVSTGAGESPLWSPDGSELFYIGDDAIMGVPVDTKSTFRYGKPKMLFRGNFVVGYGDSPPYDIHPDGKRFLMMKRAGVESDESATGTPRKINIVLNWFEELKQRVPVD